VSQAFHFVALQRTSSTQSMKAYLQWVPVVLSL
jgi:hypothetical protein